MAPGATIVALHSHGRLPPEEQTTPAPSYSGRWRPDVSGCGLCFQRHQGALAPHVLGVVHLEDMI